MTARAVMETKISGQLVTVQADGSAFVKIWPDLPPADWYVRGPRGGLYRAVGERTRVVTQLGDDWMTGCWTVVDHSAGVRYVRPRSGRT